MDDPIQMAQTTAEPALLTAQPPAQRGWLDTAKLILTSAIVGGGIVMLLLPSAPLSTTPSLPFADNFDQADGSALGPAWQPRAGKFSIQKGTLVTGGETNVLLKNGEVGDIQVQANITLGTGNWAGVLLRYAGPGEHYFANWFGVAGRYYVGVWRHQAGTLTALGQAEVPAGSGRLGVEMVGPSLRIYVNGTLALSVSDTGLATGVIGFQGSQSATFDNVFVDLPAQQPQAGA